MPCEIDVLKRVPLFGLLDDEELMVLAAQVELKMFAPRQRIYKAGDTAQGAYVVVSGAVRVTTIDEDNQEVVVDRPGEGEFFGFASMMAQTPHQTEAITIEETTCIEVTRDDIGELLHRKPHAGIDMMAVLGRQFQAAQHLVKIRANRNPNVLIEEEETLLNGSPIPWRHSADHGRSSPFSLLFSPSIRSSIFASNPAHGIPTRSSY